MSNATESTQQDKPAAKAGRRPSPGLGLRECPACGTEFQPYREWQRACSRKCRSQIPPDPEHLMPVPYTCERCGADCVGYASGGGGRFSYCDKCRPIVKREQMNRKNAVRRLNGTLDDEIRRDKNRRIAIRQYGIEWEQYERMLAAQGGVCAICGKPPKGGRTSSGRLHVDHDHACCPGMKSCGKCIRGLLCSNCNRGIGCLQDDPAILTAALRYVTS
jgi:hypothetical protein